MTHSYDPPPAPIPCAQSGSQLFQRRDLGPASWCAPGPLLGIAPAVLDASPNASPPRPVTARLAVRAPGSDKASGLIDIAVLCPNARRRRSMSRAAHRHVARLALEAPGSDGSGVVVVEAPVAPAQDSGGFVFRPSVDVLPPEMEHFPPAEATNTKRRNYPALFTALFVALAISSLVAIVAGLNVVPS